MLRAARQRAEGSGNDCPSVSAGVTNLIRQAAVAVSISGLEELQNSGEEAIIDLLESRIMNAEDSVYLGSRLYLFVTT